MPEVVGPTLVLPVLAGPPASGKAGQVYYGGSMVWLCTATGTPGTWTGLGRLVTQVTKTADYVLALTDDVVEMNAAVPTVVTVPANAAVPFPVGTVIEVCQLGAGDVSIASTAGVTLRSPGGLVILAGLNASASLRKRGTDEWMLEGNLR